jgi:hypothetical protein
MPGARRLLLGSSHYGHDRRAERCNDPIAAVDNPTRRANCSLTRRCTLRGRVAQMSGAELGFASIRRMSIREATTADFRSESFHSRICHRIDALSGPRPRIDYQWPFKAASESKVKNAKQIALYALGFLCFSPKPCGKIFDLFSFCVFHAFSM